MLNGNSAQINNFNIQIAFTQEEELTGFNENLNPLFSDDISINDGWNDFTFDHPIFWDGNDNIIVQTCLITTTIL